MDSLHLRRIHQLRVKLEKNGLAQMIVSSPSALWYLTGETIHPGERLTVFIVYAAGGACWVRNQLFPLKEKGLSTILNRFSTPDTIIDAPFADGSDGMALLSRALYPRADTGIDWWWPSGFLLDLMSRKGQNRFVNASPLLDEVRAIKDDAEILAMSRASAINDKAMVQLSQWLHTGVTEKECADKLLEIYHALGADGFSFYPVISFGPHGADPHHEPDNTPLSSPCTVLLDIGCKKDGYCSDMTRTWFFGGGKDGEKRVHDIVREANELAVKSIHPGMPLSVIDKIARDHIAEAGYGRYFTHRLGHFIGITAHEAGEVSSSSKITAQPGMIFSIEPGIYLPGRFGVRVEDLVLVTADGCRVLNHVPHSWDLQTLSVPGMEA
jgi:Xaa-Pro dipeptidase